MHALRIIVTKATSSVCLNTVHEAINDFSSIIFFSEPETETCNRFSNIENLKMILMVMDWTKRRPMPSQREDIVQEYWNLLLWPKSNLI